MSFFAFRRWFTVSNLLWIVGALALSILGSGLWDFMFKPVFLLLGEGAVAVANLGSKALEDSMYREIARGYVERASELTLLLLMSAMIAIFLGVPVSAIHTPH